MALFFEIDLSNSNLFGALLVTLAGSISLIGIGIVASILPLLYPERGAQMSHIIQASFLLISGVYYPITVAAAVDAEPGAVFARDLRSGRHSEYRNGRKTNG